MDFWSRFAAVVDLVLIVSFVVVVVGVVVEFEVDIFLWFILTKYYDTQTLSWRFELEMNEWTCRSKHTSWFSYSHLHLNSHRLIQTYTDTDTYVHTHAHA